MIRGRCYRRHTHASERHAVFGVSSACPAVLSMYRFSLAHLIRVRSQCLDKLEQDLKHERSLVTRVALRLRPHFYQRPSFLHAPQDLHIAFLDSIKVIHRLQFRERLGNVSSLVNDQQRAISRDSARDATTRESTFTTSCLCRSLSALRADFAIRHQQLLSHHRRHRAAPRHVYTPAQTQAPP